MIDEIKDLIKVIENSLNSEDIERTITLCLRHRLRTDPMQTISTGEKVSEVFKNIFMDSQI